MCVHNETLFLVDAGQEMCCVRKWSIPDARLIATFGSPGSDPGQFKCPVGICTSPDGELLFVADQDTLRVQVLRSTDGAPVRAFDATTLRLAHSFHCRSLKMAQNGELLVCCKEKAAAAVDTNYGISELDTRILVIDAETGEFKREIGPNFLRGTAAARLSVSFFNAFCSSSDGLLLFVAENDERVLVFDSNGVYQRCIVSPAWCPPRALRIVGICVSKVFDRELLFVVEAGSRSRDWNGNIRVFECSTGEQISEYGINFVEHHHLLFIAARVTSSSADTALTTLECWYSCGNREVTVFSATASS